MLLTLNASFLISCSGGVKYEGGKTFSLNDLDSKNSILNDSLEKRIVQPHLEVK